MGAARKEGLRTSTVFSFTDDQERATPGRCVHCKRVPVRDGEELCWRCRLVQTRTTLEHLRTLLREHGRSEAPKHEAGEDGSD